jgi:hypothetical protein
MSGNRSPIRRLVAALLLVCFAFYGIEAEVADIHDQEAQVVQNSPDDSPSVPDTHSFHVCHCSHTHTGVVPLVPQLTSMVIHSGDQLRFVGTSISNLRLAPPFRPPIL